MKKNTIIALVVAVLAIAGTVVFLWQYDKKQNTAPEAKPEPTTPGTTPGTTTPQPATVSAFPLKQGSKGEEVKKLQRKMNEFISYNYFTMAKKPPYQTLSVDGDFGPKTLANVKFIFGTTTVTQAQYNKFLSKTIIPDTTNENSYLSDPFNFLNF